MREFNEHELARWRGGLWHQDWRYGRWGWWYGVDDVWYPYDAPIYPYPVEVSEIVVPDGVVVADGPGEIVAPADVAPGAPPYVPGPVAIAVTAPSGTEIIVNPLPAAPPVAYRCATPVGVYPAVRLCPDVWSVVVP